MILEGSDMDEKIDRFEYFISLHKVDEVARERLQDPEEWTQVVERARQGDYVRNRRLRNDYEAIRRNGFRPPEPVYDGIRIKQEIRNMKTAIRILRRHPDKAFRQRIVAVYENKLEKLKQDKNRFCRDEGCVTM